MEAIAEAMDVIPDIFVGIAGTVDYVQLPLGTKLAGLFETSGPRQQHHRRYRRSNQATFNIDGGWMGSSPARLGAPG